MWMLACHLGRLVRLRANDRPRKPISLAIATAMNTPALPLRVGGRASAGECKRVASAARGCAAAILWVDDKANKTKFCR